ncbi:MAG: tetratricopeptide repeat protein [Acidobacteriia bacterium]|nr:tetratricopeptide repeat protein [Terriglobia bacterium]
MMPRHAIHLLLVMLLSLFGFSLTAASQSGSKPADAQDPPKAEDKTDNESAEEKPRKSVAELKKELAELEAAKGKEHPDLIPILQDMARAYDEQEGYVPALESMQRALAIARKSPGEDDLKVAGISIIVATLERAAGDSASALQHYETVRGTVEKKMGPDHIGNTRVRVLMGSAYLDLGRLSDAEAMLEKAFQRLVQDYGAASEEVSPVQELLGEVYLREGKLFAAEQQLQYALVVRSEAGDIPVTAGQLTTADAQAIMAPIRNLLGALYTVAGLYDKAEPLLNDALKAYEAKMGPQAAILEKVLVNLAALAEAKGDTAAAAGYQKRAEQIHKATTGFSHLPNVPLPRPVKVLATGDKAGPMAVRVGDWVSYGDGDGAPLSKKEVVGKTATALLVANFEWDAKERVWMQHGEAGVMGLTEGVTAPAGASGGELKPGRVNIKGNQIQTACKTVSAGDPMATQCKVCLAPEVVPLGGLVQIECNGKTVQRLLDFGRGK